MLNTEKTHGVPWPFFPQPKQQKAWDLMAPYERATINGYGGPKYGGKSYNIDAIGCTMGWDKPLHMVVFGREYDALKDLHIEPIKARMRDFIDMGKFKWNANDKQFSFAETGSILKFIQVERPSQILKHNGKRFDIVFIDEAQHFTGFELSFFPTLCGYSHVASAAREKIRTHILAADNEEQRHYYRKRLEQVYYYPKSMYCFNWGNAGHNWLVSKFYEGCSHERQPERIIEGNFETRQIVDSDSGRKKKVWVENPANYRYVFAHWKDNPKGYKENPNYIAMLKQLPEPYRSAWEGGDPYAFAGLKYKIVPGIHEVDMDKILARYGGIVPDHWNLVGGLDPGTASYCAFSLYAIDPAGNCYQLTDYYKDKMSFEEHAEQIWYNIKHCRWLDSDHLRLPDYVVAGKDAFHRKSRYAIQSHDVTLADIFWDKYKIRLVAANTDRRLGAMALADALGYRLNDKGGFKRKPKLYFATYKEPAGGDEFKTIHVCQPTIDEITRLESDPHDKEDIKRGENIEDHAFDKTKYFLLGKNKPPEKKEDKKQMHEHSDYGRIPKQKVWSRDKDTEYDMEGALGVGALEETM